MILSVLNDCILLREKPFEKTKEYLRSINLHIFDDLIDKKGNEARFIILYILAAYSEESPLIILRRDSKVEGLGICEFLGIPEYLRNDLVDLKEPLVRKAVSDYLIEFAKPLFRVYRFLQIQMRDLEIDLVNRRFRDVLDTKDKEEGETVQFIWNTKEHSKAQTEYRKLGAELQRLEMELKTQIKALEGIEEMRKAKDDNVVKSATSGSRRGNVEQFID